MMEWIKNHVRAIFIIATIIDLCFEVSRTVGVYYELTHEERSSMYMFALVLLALGVYKVLFTFIAVNS